LNLPDIFVRLAQPSDCDQLASLRSSLWPGSSTDEHARETALLLTGNASVPLPLAIFVAEASGGVLAGFLEIDLRSHADGCNPSRPVGYVEGWFIAQEYRRQTLGSRLMAAAEDWARSQGCLEMASDTWIDNELSQSCHQALGFEVIDRCVHYRKGAIRSAIATWWLPISSNARATAAA
jgi:aminoglycoside 6'-N-acetyltransferase I